MYDADGIRLVYQLVLGKSVLFKTDNCKGV